MVLMYSTVVANQDIRLIIGGGTGNVKWKWLEMRVVGGKRE
jgi:hypothetical protein